MRRPRFLISAAILASMTVAVCSCRNGESSSAPPENLRPDSGAKTVVLARGPGGIVRSGEELAELADYLEERLPVKIQIRIAHNAADLKKRLGEQEFDIVHLAPLEYVVAERSGDVRPIVTYTQNGVFPYFGAIVTRDSSIVRAKDLVGKRVTYVTAESASGYLYPLAALLDRGIRPIEDFPVFEASGSQENVIHNLKEGRYDAGFVLDEVWRDMPELEKDPALRIVARTDSIPRDLIAFSKAFIARDSELAASMTNVLLHALEDARGAVAIRRAFRRADRIIPARDVDYAAARKLIARLRRRGIATP